jgi:hypothetical protein
VALVGLAAAKRAKNPDRIRTFLVASKGIEPLLWGFRRVPSATDSCYSARLFRRSVPD